MTLGFYFTVGGLSTSGALGISIITSLLGRLREPSFYPVYGQFWILAVSKCLPEMIHFFLDELRFISIYFGPVSVLITLYLVDR